MGVAAAENSARAGGACRRPASRSDGGGGMHIRPSTSAVFRGHSCRVLLAATSTMRLTQPFQRHADANLASKSERVTRASPWTIT